MNDCLLGFDLAGVYGKEPSWMNRGNGWYFGVMAGRMSEIPWAFSLLALCF
jgi:hypothetical protein